MMSVVPADLRVSEVFDPGIFNHRITIKLCKGPASVSRVSYRLILKYFATSFFLFYIMMSENCHHSIFAKTGRIVFIDHRRTRKYEP